MQVPAVSIAGLDEIYKLSVQASASPRHGILSTQV